MTTDIKPKLVDTEVWYAIEWSHKDADDWYPTATTADTEESIRAKLVHHQTNGPTKATTTGKIAARFDYRIVRKTLTSEVLP